MMSIVHMCCRRGGGREIFMKQTWIRILCAALMLCMLLSAMGCQNDPPVDTEQPGDGPSDTTPPDQAPGNPSDPGTDDPPAQITDFQLNESYVLVRPDTKTDDEVEAIALLGRGLESAYGHPFAMGTDYVGKDGASAANQYEILIGATNRPESQAVIGELGYNDWCYKVVSSKVIVICGGSPAATLRATKAFLADVIGYEEDEAQAVIQAGSAVTLQVGAEYSYAHEYTVTSFKLGKHEISEYTLVTSKKNKSAAAAQAIVDHFRSLMGIEIPVMALDVFKSKGEGPAIFLGCADTDDKHLSISPYGKDRYFITESDDDIVIDCMIKETVPTAAEHFIRLCTPAELSASVTVAFDVEDPITALHIPEGTNSLKLDSIEKTEMAPGVVYEEHVYFDPNGKPVRAYVLTIAPGAATIAPCMPKDEDRIGTYANIKNQVIAAKENGKNVIAGINADFFEDTMLGLCIRDGVVLHDLGGRQWFGITTDGKAVMGEANEYGQYQGKLVSAVGGSNIIINNDYVTNISVNHEFGYTRHPRTAVGIKPDGTVIFMVVDGRQSSISNGASLADLADLLGAMGCHEAINLDGGGSSTFVLANGEGGFDVKNSPSDGSLRSVANGLMVILP